MPTPWKLAATLRAALQASNQGASAAPPSSGGMTGVSGLAQTSPSAAWGTNSLGGQPGSSTGGGLGSGTTTGLNRAATATNPARADRSGRPTTNSLIISARAAVPPAARRDRQSWTASAPRCSSREPDRGGERQQGGQFGIQWQTSGNPRQRRRWGDGTNSNVPAAASSTWRWLLPRAIRVAHQQRPGQWHEPGHRPRINGKYYLGALANFLENTGDANVLSTPT